MVNNSSSWFISIKLFSTATCTNLILIIIIRNIYIVTRFKKGSKNTISMNNLFISKKKLYQRINTFYKAMHLLSM